MSESHFGHLGRYTAPLRNALHCRACNTWMIRLDDQIDAYVAGFYERHAHPDRAATIPFTDGMRL